MQASYKKTMFAGLTVAVFIGGSTFGQYTGPPTTQPPNCNTQAAVGPCSNASFTDCADEPYQPPPPPDPGPAQPAPVAPAANSLRRDGKARSATVDLIAYQKKKPAPKKRPIPKPEPPKGAPKPAPGKCDGSSTYIFDDFFQCTSGALFDCIDGSQKWFSANCTWEYSCMPNAQGTLCVPDPWPKKDKQNPKRSYKVIKVNKVCGSSQPGGPPIRSPSEPPDTGPGPGWFGF